MHTPTRPTRRRSLALGLWLCAAGCGADPMVVAEVDATTLDARAAQDIPPVWLDSAAFDAGADSGDDTAALPDAHETVEPADGAAADGAGPDDGVEPLDLSQPGDIADLPDVPAPPDVPELPDVTAPSDVSEAPDASDPVDVPSLADVPIADDTPAPPDDTPAPPDDTHAPPDDTPAPPDDTPAPPDDTAAPPEDTSPPFHDYVYPTHRVGIFYLAWHAYAASAMAQVPPAQQRTIEDVIRTPGATFASLIDDFGLYGAAAGFHYQARPTLGFYCLYRPRPGEAAILPTCPNIPTTAATHAAQLWSAGVDFIYADLTNLAYFSDFADALGIRPIEVLFEEWRALRQAGTMTPQIAVWVPISSPSGGEPLWQRVRDLYTNPAFDDLVLRDGKTGRKVLFAVQSGGFALDPASVAALEAAGITVAPLWGLNSQGELDAGRASWMQPCEAPGPPDGSLQFTTLVSHTNPCLQRYTTTSPLGTVLSVSSSYQLGYASRPFQATGKNDGLTLKRQFVRAFEVQPDFLLVNSWNELIAQPQANAEAALHGAMADSMGLVPSASPTTHWLWVDGYGAEFTRDLEPTAEWGDGPYELLTSCLRAYRAGGCGAAPGEACCDMSQTRTVVFSVRGKDSGHTMTTDHVLTTDFGELVSLLSGGAFEQVCSPFYGPPSICGDSAGEAELTADGPFQLFTKQGPGETALYRCYSGADHFLSTDPGCEGRTTEALLGFMAPTRSSRAPRPLCRCLNTSGSVHFHWLAESCPNKPGVVNEGVLGFVR